MGKVSLPTEFSAKCSNGSWVSIPLKREPFFRCAIRVAQEMYHQGPRDAFATLATRSALLAVVNDALLAGKSLDGATLGSPAMIGIPAEVYLSPPSPSFFARVVRMVRRAVA